MPQKKVASSSLQSTERVELGQRRGGAMNSVFPYFLVLLLMLASGLIGALWMKVQQPGSSTAPLASGAPTTAQQPTQPTTPTVTMDTVKSLFSKDLVKFGDATSKVLFVEIADPSCPYCHVSAGRDPELNRQIGDRFKLTTDGGTYLAPVPEMRKLIDSGKASYVYIYAPGHGNGEMGMKALYCANEQGKFWNVHDLLMTNAGYNLMNNTIKNDKTKSADLAAYLKSAIDPSFLKTCIDSGKYDTRLTSDYSLAQTLGYQGTPDYFVNTTNYPGAVSFTDMQAVVTAALK